MRVKVQRRTRLRALDDFVRDQMFPGLFARLDYRYRAHTKPPLNGQSGRKAIMSAIVDRCGIEQFVETGTFRGATTAWFAGYGLPVHTVELNHRFAILARLRFGDNPLVRTAESDSATFMEEIAADPAITARTTLFYLDAHWGEMLPLAAELTTLHRAFPRAVVVIDDFRVPHDDGYAFDDYGPGKRLDLDYLAGTTVHAWPAFFPALPGRDEDGGKRGCVVLASDDELAGRLDSIALLRRWTAAAAA